MKLNYAEVLSDCAFIYNLRCYIWDTAALLVVMVGRCMLTL